MVRGTIQEQWTPLDKIGRLGFITVFFSLGLLGIVLVAIAVL